MTASLTSCLELLQGAKNALISDNPERANTLIKQLPKDIITQIFFQIWEENRDPPEDLMARFSAEVFFVKHHYVSDILKFQKKALKSIISKLSNPTPKPLSSHTQIKDATKLLSPLITIIQIYAIEHFGSAEWNYYYQVTVEQTPELSEDFIKVWEGPDPLYPNERVCDTHFPPVLRPQIVKTDGGIEDQSFTLKLLDYLQGNRSGMFYYSWLGPIDVLRGRLDHLQAAGEALAGPPEWLLMRKNIIGRNKTAKMMLEFIDFLNRKTGAHYDSFPTAMNLATVVFAENAVRKTRPLGDASGAEGCLTFSIIQEKDQHSDGKLDLCMGGYTSANQLQLCPANFKNENCGVSLLWRFTSKA